MSEEELIHVPRGGASFNRGSSEQKYATPADFRRAIIGRFGYPTFDLAAESTNFFAAEGNPHRKNYFDEADDSLTKNWQEMNELRWLNPPFANIRPWVKKCHCSTMGIHGPGILFLVPAAVGSNWYRDYVHNHALVIFVNGRIAFKPDQPTWGYPKDCMLVHFGKRPGFEVWNWKP